MENKIYTAPVETTVVNEGLREYLMKVFNYMAGGLCITALASYLIISNPSVMRLFYNITPQSAGLSALGWIAFLAPLVIVFAFGWVINRGTASQVKGVFWLYSALMGVSLCPILLLYTGESVTRVFLITAATFGAMSLYGYTTKRDLSGLGSFLIMGLIGVIIAMVVNMFMKSETMSYALSVLSVLIFTGLTAYDIQKIRAMYVDYEDNEITTKKAVAGALSLYLDFINIFINLLRLMGDRR